MIEYEIYEMSNPPQAERSIEESILQWMRGDLGTATHAADLNQARQMFQLVNHGILVEIEDGEQEILRYK